MIEALARSSPCYIRAGHHDYLSNRIENSTEKFAHICSTMCQLIRIQLIRIQHKEHVRFDNSMISTEDGNTEKQVILKLLQTFM